MCEVSSLMGLGLSKLSSLAFICRACMFRAAALFFADRLRSARGTYLPNVAFLMAADNCGCSWTGYASGDDIRGFVFSG